MRLASLDARKETTTAISSGRAMRPKAAVLLSFESVRYDVMKVKLTHLLLKNSLGCAYNGFEVIIWK